MLAIVLALVFVHGVEIWLYAGLYLYLGAVADLETAVYFSTMTYAAIGFGDSEMAREWRLVSAIRRQWCVVAWLVDRLLRQRCCCPPAPLASCLVARTR